MSSGEYVAKLQDVCIGNDIYKFKDNKEATPMPGSSKTY